VNRPTSRLPITGSFASVSFLVATGTPFASVFSPFSNTSTVAGIVAFELGLELAYDSGAGNSPFGLGWHLSTPSITRKTDKGLQRYADGEHADVFVLSGAEDLVPVLLTDSAGNRVEPKNSSSGSAAASAASALALRAKPPRTFASQRRSPGWAAEPGPDADASSSRCVANAE
jgi:hypothetical protein